MPRPDTLFICGLFICIASAEAATGAWVVRDRGGVAEAFVTSANRTVALVVSCSRGKPLFLDLHNVARSGWKGGQSVSLLVNERSFPVGIEGHSESVTLSNLPGGALGIDSDLTSAMKAAGTVTLTGPAVSGMPKESRSFPIAGAREALTALEAKCGVPRADVSGAVEKPPAQAAAKMLSGDEIRHAVVGRSHVLTSDGIDWQLLLKADGNYFYGEGRAGELGPYQISADGAVCLKRVESLPPCVRYRRSDKGGLRLLDAASGKDLGPLSPAK